MGLLLPKPLTLRAPDSETSVEMKFKRLFTPQEAESTLPLVRGIVADILETGRKVREMDERDPDRGRLTDELGEHIAELEGLGCFFKDWNFSVGLVDFPAVINGETVFLCWRSDEGGLSWYHRIEEGYQGRRPLPKTPAGA